jgi:hypothetical protein
VAARRRRRRWRRRLGGSWRWPWVKPSVIVQRRQKAQRAQKARTTKPMMTATAGRTISPDMGCTKGSRAHPIRQTTTPAPVSGGSPPCCSSAPATANAPGLLMLFQVVAIQP